MTSRLLGFCVLILLCCVAPAWSQPDTHAAAEGATKSHPANDNQVRFWYALPLEDAARFETLLAKLGHHHRHLQVAPRNFASADALREALLSGAEPLPHLALIDVSWQAELIA